MCKIEFLMVLQRVRYKIKVMTHLICWSRRYAERIRGEFFILARRILGKLPANFSANFDGEFR